MKISCIIFDLDGTLLNTIGDLANSMNFALRSLSLPTHTTEECLAMVGSGKREFVQRALPPDRQELLDEVSARSSEHYYKNCTQLTKPYDGISELISNLKHQNYQLCVLSNKDDTATNQLTKHYFPAGSFEIVNGAKPDMPLKPDPKAVFEMIKELDVDDSQTLFIGDSEIDVSTGRAAGLFTVAVSWGFRKRTLLEQHQPDVIIDNPLDLLDVINNGKMI